jgi:hypothetical protein
MTRTVRAATEIAASPDRVWHVLTDFAAYPDWNPFIPRLAGSPAVGVSLDARITPPGGRGMRFRPTVLMADPGRELRWLGHLLIPGLFDGEHAFRIEELAPGRSRFVQEERFTGILAPVLLRLAAGRTRQGFEAMNGALKRRAEAASPIVTG